MERAELLPAFLWICPGCGCDNFERTIVAELSEEEHTELRNDHGVEVWEQGEFLTSPTRVTCSHCTESFDTEEYGINNDSSNEECLEDQIICGLEGQVKLTEEQFARVLDHWKRLNPRRMLTEQEVLAISRGSQLW